MSYAPLPTAAQVSVTRQQICDQENDIVVAEQQIIEHEARIAALRSKILSTRKEIAAKKAYLAPIRRLPFEVVGDIVTICATDQGAPVQQLRILSSICKTWRDATLRTPKAWTKIPIVVGSQLTWTGHPGLLGSRETLGTAKDVQEWYDRSGCCKKDVSITWGGRYHHPETEQLDAIIQIIISRPSELRRFAREDSYTSDERTVRCFSPPMPSLHALDLANFEPDISFISTLAISSPRLTCLRVGRLVSGNVLVPLQSRLKSLIIQRVDLNVLLTMLGSGGFSSLQALCIFYIEGAVATVDRTTIVLPLLRAFYVRHYGSEASFLEMLDMPRLESFAFKNASLDRPSKKDGAILSHILAKRRMPLRELRLESFWMSDAELLRLLKATPSLESLAILDGKTSDKVISALSSRQTRPASWLCPNLSRICIVSSRSTKSTKFMVSTAALEEFLSARLAAHRAESAPGATPEVTRILDMHLDDQFMEAKNMDGGVHWKTHYVHDESILPSCVTYTKKYQWWTVKMLWGELS